MRESVKKCSRLCSEAETRGWISRVARGLQAARRCTRVKHAEKLNRHASCSITGQKVQTSHSVSLWLGLMTQSCREAKSPVHSVMEKLTLRIPLTKSISHLTHICEKAFWCFGKQFKRNQFIFVDAMCYSRI